MILQTEKTTKKTITIVLTILIITAMVSASEFFGEKEIIFPEIAAIAVGMLLAPKRSWQTSKIRILLLITMSAAIGLGISVFVSWPLWIKMAIAFLICQFILAFSRTSFAPLISAAVLPVMLETKSIIYLIAAVLLTSAILLSCLFLEKLGYRKDEPFQPMPTPTGNDYFLILAKAGIGIFCIFAAVKLDFRFAVAPPMLVAFTEFMNKDNKARKSPIKSVGLITVCALTGAVSRFLLCVTWGLPLTVAALTASVIMVALLIGLNHYLPPAGALTILAMLIPEGSLITYPLQVFIGIGILMTASILYHKIA